MQSTVNAKIENGLVGFGAHAAPTSALTSISMSWRVKAGMRKATAELAGSRAGCDRLAGWS